MSEQDGRPALWALLIGIDDYQAVTKLRGCVKDAQTIRQLLIDTFKVPEERIKLLINGEASREGILKTFVEFLIQNENIKHGDQILFHYSGHGSQMPDHTGTEPDGQNETLVAWDSRLPGIFDIPDKTLAGLLDKLAEKKGENITVILDCCHSGSGTRQVQGVEFGLTRQAAASTMTPPPELDAELLSAIGAAPAQSTRSVHPDSGQPTAKHVLLAGCRSSQLANEHPFKDDQGKPAAHGALTFFLLQELATLTPSTTYTDIHERIASQVNTLYPTQMPQCEGQRSRVVFGGVKIEREIHLSVTKVEGESIMLSGGSIMGLNNDIIVDLYPPETRSLQDLPAPLASARITSVTATTAKAEVIERGVAVPLHARALMTARGVGRGSQKVALRTSERSQPGDEQLLEQLRAVISNRDDGRPSLYLEIVNEGEPADLAVIAEEGKLRIFGQDGRQLVNDEQLDAVRQPIAHSVLFSLETIARFRSLLQLKNPNPDAPLAQSLKISVYRVENGVFQPLPDTAIDAHGMLQLTFDPADERANYYAIEVENNSPIACYIHIFVLGSDYSVTRLYPNDDSQEKVEPKRKLRIPSAIDPTQMEIYLPDGWNYSSDRLKVIATTEQIKLDGLIQQGLNVPPPLNRPARPRTEQHEEWGTAELPFAVVRKQ